MHDIEIRARLRVSLTREFDQNSIILDEMPVPGHAARIDVAVVNGELHGFEIKSDADTLKRLASQQIAYSALFDRLTLVVGERHYVAAMEIIPDWWGVRVARSGSSELAIEREAQGNSLVDPSVLVRLLWKHEVLNLLEWYGFSISVKRQYAYERNKMLIEAVSLTSLKAAVRDTIKLREHWRPGALRTPCGAETQPASRLRDR